MTSLKTQQDAMVKSAEQSEKLVEVISKLSEKIETQHEDNVKFQRYVFWANIIMVFATVVMAIATGIMAFKA